MPIKWSALEVVEAMDEIQELLDQAEPFLVEAEVRARKATNIARLPQYMNQRLHRLIFTIESRQRMRDSVRGIRDCIPKDAIAAERASGANLQLDL
jgi:hypothetical protein